MNSSNIMLLNGSIVENSATYGALKLDSDVIYHNDDGVTPTPSFPKPLYINIPNGLALNIHSIYVTGKAAKYGIEYTNDVSAGIVNWRKLHTINIATDDAYQKVEFEKPITVHGFNGNKSAIRLYFDNSALAPSSASMIIGIEYINE